MKPDESIDHAKNRAYGLLQHWEAELESGTIDEAAWYREVAAVITPAYLSAGNPRAQSGHGGDEERWLRARGLIADAIHRDGTFLDVGCASGYLMECIRRWTAAKGLAVEPYGLDIAPELAELARRRLPEWAHRVYTGNVMDWEPPCRFDFVRTGLEYVPRRRQCGLVTRLLETIVAPGGRLIIGTYNEESEAHRTGPLLEETVAGWGFPAAGRSERTRPNDHRVLYKVLWLDALQR